MTNLFLLAEGNFIAEMHLQRPELMYSACSPFNKNKKLIKKSQETGDLRYIYQNELDKVFSQPNMTSEDFKDLARRSAADKVLRDKAENLKYDGYQRGLVSMVPKFFD